VQSDHQQPIQRDERGAVHVACVQVPSYQGPQNLDLQVMVAFQRRNLDSAYEWVRCEMKIFFVIFGCSGDIDGVVPTTGTRYWLRELGLTVQVPWYPWNHSTQVWVISLMFMD
jgi:hypothetical protein